MNEGDKCITNALGESELGEHAQHPVGTCNERENRAVSLGAGKRLRRAEGSAAVANWNRRVGARRQESAQPRLESAGVVAGTFAPRRLDNDSELGKSLMDDHRCLRPSG